MNIQLFLLYIAVLLFFVITIAIVVVAFEIASTLKALKNVLLDVEDTTHDIKAVKSTIKRGVFSLFSTIVRIVR